MHFHLRRFALDDLPTSDEQLAEWLYARWAEKDERLDAFYAQAETSRTFAQSASEAEAQRKFADRRRWTTQRVQLALLFAAALLLAMHTWVSWRVIASLHVLAIAAWIIVGRFGGFDALVLRAESAAAGGASKKTN